MYLLCVFFRRITAHVTHECVEDRHDSIAFQLMEGACFDHSLITVGTLNPYPHPESNPSLFVCCNYGGVNPPSRGKFAFNFNPVRIACLNNIVENHVGDTLIKRAHVAIRQHVVFKRLEFKTGFIRHVVNVNRPKVRQAGFGAHRREFRALGHDMKPTRRVRVIKGVNNRQGRFSRHSIHTSRSTIHQIYVRQNKPGKRTWPLSTHVMRSLRGFYHLTELTVSRSL